MTALTAGLAAQETRHSEEMSELRNMQRAIAAGMIELQQTQRATEQELKALAESTRELDKAQKITEEKLHILIETVDRIIRDRK
jgi:septal ring factor EnvC (AmiA/AmiB activator)